MLTLPKLLQSVIKDKSWQDGLFDNNIVSILKRKNLDEGLKIYYYDESLIISETRNFAEILERNYTEEIKMFLGETENNTKKYAIDPKKVILIADFGLGSDQPIALDTRNGFGDPPVWLLVWANPNYWIKLSSRFSLFIQGKE